MQILCPCGHWTASKRGRTLSRHRNAGLELVLVLNGAVTWDYEGRPVHVPARHLSFTWPWQWHGAMNDVVPSSELCWVILPFRTIPLRPSRRMELHPTLGLTRAENRLLMDRLLTLERPIIKASRLLCQFLPRAVEILEHDGKRPALGSRALLLSALSELIEATHEPPATPVPDARTRVVGGLDLLAAHCAETWSLERMAGACGMGRTHFTRWVKELTGDTPVQFLNRKRIEQAERLLKQGQRSVTDIALTCGFQSSQYFATVYRTFTGTTPRHDRAGQAAGKGDGAPGGT